MGDAENAALKGLGRALAEAQDERLEEVDLAGARDRLLRAAAARRRSRAVVAGSTGVLAMAAAVLLFLLFRAPPLRFAIGEGQAGRADEWIAAPVTAPLPLHFSDGSTVALAPDARARVADLDARGARVVLERGALVAQVIHREATRWRVDSGPFQVRVTGTKFEVAWAPEREELRLVLVEGSVRVSGPILGEERAVAAGQALVVRVKEKRFELSDASERASASSSESAAAPPVETASSRVEDATAPAPTNAAPAPEPPRVTSTAPSSAPTLSPAPAESAVAAAKLPSFRDLVAARKWADALKAAETEGFSDFCDRASADDLMALADAARYAGSGARANEALSALRRRFPGDARAASAAFLLGRTAFDQRGAYAEAARWFSTYLAEQPGGALAREASGRLMECYEKMGDRASARAAAKRYLAAWPGGPHAAKAESLLAE